MYKHYDRKTTTMFGVIGSYFVYIFYNKLYIKAHNKNKLNDKSESLTDEYKNTIRLFMYGVQNEPKYYSQTVKEIHEYYQHETKYSTISLVEFLDNILECFVPEEYFHDLKEVDKEFFINKIVTEAVLEFGVRILTFEKLSSIIDQHNDQHNVEILQKDMNEIFSDIRERIFNHFTRQLTGKNKEEQVDIGIVNKIKMLLTKTAKEKTQYQTQLEQAKKIINALNQQIDALKSDIKIHNEQLDKLTKNNVGGLATLPESAMDNDISRATPHNTSDNTPTISSHNTSDSTPHNTPTQNASNVLDNDNTTNTCDNTKRSISRRSRRRHKQQIDVVQTSDPFSNEDPFENDPSVDNNKDEDYKVDVHKLKSDSEDSVIVDVGADGVDDAIVSNSTLNTTSESDDDDDEESESEEFDIRHQQEKLAQKISTNNYGN